VIITGIPDIIKNYYKRKNKNKGGNYEKIY